MLTQNISELLDKYHSAQKSLEDPEIASDPDQVKELSSTIARLRTIAELAEKNEDIAAKIVETEKMIETEKDDEIIKMAKDELVSLQDQLTENKTRKFALPLVATKQEYLAVICSKCIRVLRNSIILTSKKLR